VTEGPSQQLGFDPEALRARYRAERDKRLRADGNDQYVEVKGAFNEGKPGERAGQNGFYGGGSVEFFRILQEWPDAGDMKGLELQGT
jgi:hypothetical protein